MARSSSRALLRIFSSSPQPIYVVDTRRTIVFCNQACAEWVGIDAEELRGVRCDYHGGANSAASSQVAARLCPPPECFEGSHKTARVDGKPDTGASRRAQFIPLQDGHEHCAVVAIVQSTQGGEVIGPDEESHRIDLDAAALHRRLADLRRDRASYYRLDRLAGESPAIRRAAQQAQLAASVGGNVLIVGPPGCDSEYVAHAIHYGGERGASGRLVPLACELLDPELIQSAVTDFKRQWALESHGRSTLLLMNVDRLPKEAQVELAGFLTLPGFHLDTVSTSEAPLVNLAEQERFHPSLAFRLSTLVIELPPLAARREDLPLLAQCLVEGINAQGEAQRSGFSPEALDRLAEHPWHGDVAELAEVVAAAHKTAPSALIGAADLPPQIALSADAAAYPAKEPETVVLDQLLAEIEYELISRALAEAKGNKSKAAEMLGITRARLHRRIAQSPEGEPDAGCQS